MGKSSKFKESYFLDRIWSYGGGFKNKGYEEIFKSFEYDKNEENYGRFEFLSTRYTDLEDSRAVFGICNLDFRSESEAIAGNPMYISDESVGSGNGRLVPVVSIDLKKANCDFEKIEGKNEFKLIFK